LRKCSRIYGPFLKLQFNASWRCLTGDVDLEWPHLGVLI